jgi:cell division protein FtsB
MASKPGALFRRAAWGALAIGATLFALQGGEFGSTDLLRQRSERARVARSIDSLQRLVDSLKRYHAAVMQDPATQERLAREVFGMVRGDKELLYRFTDTSGRTRDR